MAEPHFGGGPEKAAVAAFQLREWKAARDGFKKALDTGRPKPERLRLMVALSNARLGNHAVAAPALEKAAAEVPVIADYLRYNAARSYFEAGDPAKAFDLASQVNSSSISGAEAALLIADTHRVRSQRGKEIEVYDKYLRERPDGIRLAEVRYRLARAYEATGRPRAQALPLYRKVTVAAPLSSWASRSKERIEALTARMSGAKQARWSSLTAAELVERGKVYFRAMRNEKSEADFAAALKAPGLTADIACVAAYHQATSVFKQRNRTKAAPLFDVAMAKCDKTDNVDLQIKSAYTGGRSYAKIRERDVAIRRYQKAERIAAKAGHSYADDARLRTAEEYADLKNDAKVTEMLAEIPTRYPKGDMRAEAMWRLGFRAYRRKNYNKAIEWWKKQIAAKPIDDNYWAEGQAQYWIGRSLAKLGRDRDAVASYIAAIETYPMSYYALLALNRLREKHSTDFAKVTARIKQPPKDYDPSAPAFSFKPRAIYGSPGFARALEFLRLGIGTPARLELARLGLLAPKGKSRVTDPDTIDKLWAMAFLYDRAGRYAHSHWTTRWHILDFKRGWPVGKNRARWNISYPKAWWPLLDRHAKKHGYPTELLIAHVREESAFDPLRESFANAIGLTQMIFSTGRRFAKGTGIRVSRSTLRDPEKNVTIGSRFLAFLVRRYQGRFALTVPAYNAGEGACDRWLRQRGTWDTDEWAEAIPYDETRRYSKRVLATYFAYSYLANGTIPEMPNDIPPSVIRRR